MAALGVGHDGRSSTLPGAGCPGTIVLEHDVTASLMGRARAALIEDLAAAGGAG